LLPPSSTRKSSPRLYCFSPLASRECKPAFLRTSSTFASSIVLNGSKLNFSVPLNKVGSYGITVIFDLRSLRFNEAISIPSISIEPFSSSIILLSVSAIVDLPAPVRPQMPTFWPGSISNVKSFKTIAVFGLYLNETFLK